MATDKPGSHVEAEHARLLCTVGGAPLARTYALAGKVVTGTRDAAVRRLRAVLGRRDVNLTPDFMGFGNHLYLWVWAHARRNDRVSPKVLVTDKMRYWASLVPDFADRYLLEPHEVRQLDRRGTLWAHPGLHNPDPRGFTDLQRAEFIREALLPAPLLAGVHSSPLAHEDCLVINVRRGDYYSDENRGKYGFDVVSYIRRALEGSVAGEGPLRRIHLVSDDLGWCREHLSFLDTFAREVTSASHHAEPADDFRDVASARRIIMTNSTFSIWAAAVSNELHRDNSRSIWAPAFFQSVYGPGRCFEYDGQWSFIDELRDGWQPTWVLDGLPEAPA